MTDICLRNAQVIGISPAILTHTYIHTAPIMPMTRWQQFTVWPGNPQPEQLASGSVSGDVCERPAVAEHSDRLYGET
jgi:hypothetical protein